MRHARVLAALAAAALVVAACSGRDDSDSEGSTTSETATAVTTAVPATTPVADTAVPDTAPAATTPAETTTTAPAEVDPCAGVALLAGETGVSEDTITVLVMADVGSELAPGLFQGSLDGVAAWADKVNANGGLACRQVEVIEWDSALNPTETTNGWLEGCDKALAAVGSFALFVTDVNALTTCPDASGAATGLPDISAATTVASHQCSATTYPLVKPSGYCPYSGSGARTFGSNLGAYRWILENVIGGPTGGAVLIPADLPSTIEVVMGYARGFNQFGIDTTGREFGTSGRAEQATFAQYVLALNEPGVEFAYNGSDDRTMIKWRAEATAQGFDQDSVTWVCSVSCYTDFFLEAGGEDVEGTYVYINFLPYEEADINAEVATMLEYVGQERPPSWTANSWAAGLLFEQVVNGIVAADGPNALTRQAILDGLAATDSFDANGWYGPIDYTTPGEGNCYVVLQVRDGEFARVYPQERGTIACEPEALVEVDIDAAAEFAA